MSTRRAFSIDAVHLMHPGTGLATTVAEWLRAFAAVRPDVRATVFIPHRVQLASFGLAERDHHFVRIPAPDVGLDYLFRMAWGARVSRCRTGMGLDGPHFIPYLYNYGSLRRNVVMVPDLVYREFPDYGVVPPSQPWWNRRGRLPIRPLVRHLEERAAACASHLVVTSHYVAEQATSLLGVPRERLTVVPLGPPAWLTGSAQTLERASGFALPARYMLYVGGYAVRKNVPLLLRACAAVYERDRSFRCVFAGLSPGRLASMPEVVGPLPPDFLATALTGLPAVTNGDLRRLYVNSAFAAYPSHSEGFGLPVIEAGVCGRLCLAGDNSSLREVQPTASFRVDARDERGWTERILYYWQHPGAAIEAGRLCQQQAAQYTWDASVQRLLHVLLAAPPLAQAPRGVPSAPPSR